MFFDLTQTLLMLPAAQLDAQTDLPSAAGDSSPIGFVVASSAGEKLLLVEIQRRKHYSYSHSYYCYCCCCCLIARPVFSLVPLDQFININ